jgi:spermidine/putrescine transport system substrate-binding protein
LNAPPAFFRFFADLRPVSVHIHQAVDGIAMTTTHPIFPRPIRLPRWLSGLCLCVQSLNLGAAELRVLTWTDYLSPEAVSAFEKQNACTVSIEHFDSHEQMRELLQNAASPYDLIFPSSYEASVMNAEGKLLPINPKLIPNLSQVDPAFLMLSAMDDTMAYSVPYMTGTTGIGYDAKIHPELPHSWAVYDLPEVAAKATLLDDMRETLGAALKFLGYSLNSTRENEIAEAAQIVKRWKKNLKAFDNQSYREALQSGEATLVHGYSGDINVIMQQPENRNIRYLLPKEGFVVWCDDMVIPSNCLQPKLAHQFINLLLQPEMAAINMEFTRYKAPVPAAYRLVSANLRNDPSVFPPRDLLQKSEVIKPLGDAIHLYLRYWEEAKQQN